MAGLIAKVRENGRQCVRTFFIEFLALWYALRHPRVRWYAKLFVLVPLGYILSPIDLIPDALSVFGIGQADDIIVIRYSYLVLKRIIDKDVLEECRSRATAYLAEGDNHRYGVALGIAFAWVFLTSLLAWDIFKRLHRRGIM
jgi:uncharacterized membrane protein YkvA (DUF1232 family)